MSQKPTTYRLPEDDLIRAVAEELEIKKTAVVRASLRDHFYKHLTQNTTILECMERIGKKMSPPEALDRKEENLDDCCFDCSREKCEASSCVSRYGTIGAAKKKGLCRTCTPCTNFTSKPAPIKPTGKRLLIWLEAVRKARTSMR